MKNAWRILLGGLLIMALAIYLEGYVLSQLSAANGPCGLDKVVLTDSPKTTTIDNNNRLNQDDINYLQKRLSGKRVSYLVQQDGAVEANNHTISAKVLGTNYQWASFCALDMQKGGMWTPEAEFEGQKVAVISTDAALQLYGSTDVVGMDITILGKKFLINGVFLPQNGIFSRLTGDGIPEVYVPGAALFELSANSQVREIQIENTKPNAAEVAQEVSELLNGIGKASTLSAHDYYEVRILMEQVPKIQTFMIGMIFMLVLLLAYKDKNRVLVRKLRADAQEHSFAEVLKQHCRELGLHLGLTAGLLLVALLVWNRIHFDLYIPPRYIPDNLFDISFFTGVIESSIHSGQKMMAFYQPRPEILLGLVRTISRFLYYLIWPIGLAMVLYAWPKLINEGGDNNEQKALHYANDGVSISE